MTTADPTGLVTESAETLRRELWRHIGAHADIVTNDLLASGAVRSAAEERAEERERIARAIEALPTTRTQAWTKGWDSVSLAGALAAARADRAAPAEEGVDEALDKIDASLAACCEGHAKFGICYNDPEDDR